MIGAWRATSSSRKPRREHDADDERRLGRERLLEVVVLGDGAADERARRQLGAQAVDRCARRPWWTGPASGTAWISAVPPAPRLGGHDLGDAGVAPWRRRRRRAASPAGATICSGPVAPGAEGVLHLVVARRELSPVGHDLDRGHAGLEAERRAARAAAGRPARRRRTAAGGARGARPRPRSAASGARRSGPTAARACRPWGRAWPARPAAASAWRRGRR